MDVIGSVVRDPAPLLCLRRQQNFHRFLNPDSDLFDIELSHEGSSTIKRVLARSELALAIVGPTVYVVPLIEIHAQLPAATARTVRHSRNPSSVAFTSMIGV